MIEVNEEQLRSLYEGGLNTRQIAVELGIGQKTVCRRLHQFGINVRPQGSKPHEILRDKNWLRHEYISLGKSTIEIASDIGASSRVVCHWLLVHEIPTRPRNQHKGRTWSGEVRKRMSEAKRGIFNGENNPNWKGGCSPPKRNGHKAWSKSVKERDNFTCVECDSKDRVEAHHIESWVDNERLRLDIDNGITLCRLCHFKAHGKTYHGETDTSAQRLNGEDIV